MYTVPERCRSCPMWIDVTYINGSPLYAVPMCMACRQAVALIENNPYWIAAEVESLNKRLQNARAAEEHFG
jgi:hypothetical protein